VKSPNELSATTEWTLWPGTAHFLAGKYRRLRDIHTFIMDEVFTKMRKDNIAQWAQARAILFSTI
jgi:hypothetical protein